MFVSNTHAYTLTNKLTNGHNTVVFVEASSTRVRTHGNDMRIRLVPNIGVYCVDFTSLFPVNRKCSALG